MAFDRPSPNHEPRRLDNAGDGVSMLVIHYTGMESCDAALQRLCDAQAKVSAHYLIDEDGAVYDLVADDQRAWHAGVAYWRGINDVNSASVGIELVNPGHEYGYRPFPDRQIDQLITLGQNLLRTHRIPSTGVVGHSDIAPGRKTDPGELFPWSRLASKGIGIWPDANETPSSEDPWADLSRIGYAWPGDDSLGGGILDPETGQKDVITAFQRRFLPGNISGELDSMTLKRIQAVAAAYS